MHRGASWYEYNNSVLCEYMKNPIFFVIIAAGLLAFYYTARTPAESADALYDGEPEIVAATFASAWCSSCKILKPRLAAVIPEFSDIPVSFVELDFTFGEQDYIREIAEREGFEEIYDRFKGATGFTLLIDPETGEIVDTLTMNHSRKALRAAIAQAIAVATQPLEQAETTSP